MANRARGESEIEAGGRVYRLRLTLGALAEIEDGLSLNDLSEIEARLKKLRAADLAIVAAALMRGGGHEMTALEALRLPVDFPVLVRAVTQAFAAGRDAADAADLKAALDENAVAKGARDAVRVALEREPLRLRDDDGFKRSD